MKTLKDFPIWPFPIVAALILGLTVMFVPGTGNLRFWGLGIAAVVFPVFPLVGGYIVRRRQSLNDKARQQQP